MGKTSLTVRIQVELKAPPRNLEKYAYISISFDGGIYTDLLSFIRYVGNNAEGTTVNKGLRASYYDIKEGESNICEQLNTNGENGYFQIHAEILFYQV